MVCFHPMKAYRSEREFTSSGKKKIVFSEPRYGFWEPVQFPCGQCIGCRLLRSRHWALRCMHEASRHEDNCFITLTYRPEDLPKDGSLDHRHWQLFAKRMRKNIGPFRFFMCGEYGDKSDRPHYHACIFGYNFPDRVLWKKNHQGDSLYTSKILSDLWGFGYAVIGDVSFTSAAYVARYVMKKRLGKDAKAHYERVCPETGVITDLKPEYTAMSRRPGIAKDWINEFVDDVYPGDFVVDSDGKKHSPPKYYDSQYEAMFPGDLEFIKLKRTKNAQKHVDNCTPERLEVREKVMSIKVNKLLRSHDKD